jgi:hypothetical protein
MSACCKIATSQKCEIIYYAVDFIIKYDQTIFNASNCKQQGQSAAQCFSLVRNHVQLKNQRHAPPAIADSKYTSACDTARSNLPSRFSPCSVRNRSTSERWWLIRSKVLRRRWWPWLQPPQTMSVTVRATVRPIAGIAGDRKVYRQKFLNRAAGNSVSRTAPQRLSAGHLCLLQDGHTSLHANDSSESPKPAQSGRSRPGSRGA